MLPRIAAAFGIVAAILGLFFAGFSTNDFVQLLDRHLHDMHCSFTPGLAAVSTGANACSAAIYSPWSSVLRGAYWGGIPISLFAFGAYAFFLAFSVALMVLGRSASRWFMLVFSITSITPLPPSIFMFVVSATQLHQFCKLCMGLYFAALLTAVAAVLAFVYVVRAWSKPETTHGHWMSLPIGFAVLGLAALLPAMVYASMSPDYRSFVQSCGTAPVASENAAALIKLPAVSRRAHAYLVVDPMCPVCKSLHQRLIGENVIDKLDIDMMLFPLDSDCNWMLDEPLPGHQGSCLVSKAIICGDAKGRSRAILDWAFDNQETLKEAAARGKAILRGQIRGAFPEIDACIDAKDTQKRLEKMLRWAIDVKLETITPQLFINEVKICDEDQDLGLRYTLTQFAPNILQ